MEKLKRQVRYKDAIYDILKDIKLGNHNYLIIGKGTESKFFDIDFVEQKIEDEKIKYISPNMNIQFNSNIDDFSRLQGQSLMTHIVNDIKDSINQEEIIDYKDTIDYIDNVEKTIDKSNNINGFFTNNTHYDNEKQFDESIKTLIGYYETEFKEYNIDKKLPTGDVAVPEQTIKEIYDELENTQNFGVSAIYDYKSKQKDEDYIVDPTNNIYIDSNDKSEVNTKAEESITNETDEVSIANSNIFTNEKEKITIPEMDTNFDNGNTQQSDVFINKSEENNSIPEQTETYVANLNEIKENNGKPIEEIKTSFETTKEEVLPVQENISITNENNSVLSFQERLYLENEKKLNESMQIMQKDLQADLGGKAKTLTLRSNPNRMNNAAYISISFLLYLIGSLELFISLVLIAKFL